MIILYNRLYRYFVCGINVASVAMNYSDVGAGLCQVTAGGFFDIKRFQCSRNLQQKLELNGHCEGYECCH